MGAMNPIEKSNYMFRQIGNAWKRPIAAVADQKRVIKTAVVADLHISQVRE